MREGTPKPLGRVEPFTELTGIHKFVVALENGEYVLYVGDENDALHIHVVKRYQLNEDSVKGGGKIELTSDSEASLYDASTDYGGVPPEVLQLFADDLKKILGVAIIEIKPIVRPRDRERFGIV